MLSSVLNSERTVQANIAIMRAFVRLRALIASHKKIAARVEKLEQGQHRTASVIEILVEEIRTSAALCTLRAIQRTR
jgi:hypothetical protein